MYRFHNTLQYTVSVSDLYSPRIGLHISSSRIGRPIVGIYKSLEDTWMWTLGLRPRYSFSGNICFEISAVCLCSVYANAGLCYPYKNSIYSTVMSQSVLLWTKSVLSPSIYVSFPQHTLILFFVIDIDIMSQASSLCDEERPLSVEEDKIPREVW